MEQLQQSRKFYEEQLANFQQYYRLILKPKIVVKQSNIVNLQPIFVSRSLSQQGRQSNEQQERAISDSTQSHETTLQSVSDKRSAQMDEKQLFPQQSDVLQQSTKQLAYGSGDNFTQNFQANQQRQRFSLSSNNSEKRKSKSLQEQQALQNQTQNIISSIQNTISDNSYNGTINQDISNTIRQIRNMENHNSSYTHLKSCNNDIVQSQFTMLNSAAKLCRTEDFQQQKEISVQDLQVQAEAPQCKSVQVKIIQRKPQLNNIFSSSKVEEHSVSQLRLSQTSLDYLKWRRGD